MQRAPEKPEEPMEPQKFVYDYIHVPSKSSLKDVRLPPLGSPYWKKLGDTQVKRIEEEDHMVLYISQYGSAYQYKYCEVNSEGDMWRYARKNQVDLVIKRSIQATLVPRSGFISIHVYVHIGWFVMNMTASNMLKLIFHMRMTAWVWL